MRSARCCLENLLGVANNITMTTMQKGFVAACLLSVSLWHAPAMAAQPAAGAAPGGPPRQLKVDHLPAGLFAAKRIATTPTQRHERVDVPSGSGKLHLWISYPRGEGKAGVVIILPHETGLDDWTRAVADQVAHDGFIAIAPDLLTGRRPGGGNTEAFAFPDEVIAARATVTAEEALRAYQTAREYGLKLSRANGKSAGLGFSAGGTDTFRFAASVPTLNAGVVFYGAAPGEDVLARINAPLLGLYGALDPVVAPTVQNTVAAMRRLGKSFAAEIYPHASNFFLVYNDMADNGPATESAWPRAMAFLKQHLQ